MIVKPVEIEECAFKILGYIPSYWLWRIYGREQYIIQRKLCGQEDYSSINLYLVMVIWKYITHLGEHITVTQIWSR